MPDLGRILLADDEQTFREATADLLRREGYECDCVVDAYTAIEKLRENFYNLLIADIKMPGNPNLELIRKLTKLVKGMPVILVTGYPSQKSAVASVNLPVSYYMVKPIDFKVLLKNVAEAIQQGRLFVAVSNTKQRLSAWQKQLGTIEKTMKKKNRSIFSGSVKSFLELTFGNISATISDVKNLAYILMNASDEQAVCNLVSCPKLTEMTEGLWETISIIEQTKSSFKSDELEQLKTMLERLLKKTKKLKPS